MRAAKITAVEYVKESKSIGAATLRGEPAYYVRLTILASEDAMRWLGITNQMVGDLDIMSANMGFPRPGADVVGGSTAKERSQGRVDNKGFSNDAARAATSALIRELAIAAGLDPQKVDRAKLLDCVKRLAIAAKPPYEPKSTPKVRTCPNCFASTMVYLNRRTQREFTGCSAWPLCLWSYDTDPNPPEPGKSTDAPAPAYAKRKIEF